MKSSTFAVLAGVLMLSSAAFGETKILKLGKIDCVDCAAQVRDQVCASAKFEVCEVKLLDAKKAIGQLKLVTKEGQKIDMAKITKIIADAGYEVKK